MEILIGIVIYLFISATVFGFLEEKVEDSDTILFFTILWPLFLTIIFPLYFLIEYIFTPILKFPCRLGGFIARKVNNGKQT